MTKKWRKNIVIQRWDVKTSPLQSPNMAQLLRLSALIILESETWRFTLNLPIYCNFWEDAWPKRVSDTVLYSAGRYLNLYLTRCLFNSVFDTLSLVCDTLSLVSVWHSFVIWCLIPINLLTPFNLQYLTRYLTPITWTWCLNMNLVSDTNDMTPMTWHQ